VDKLNKVNVIHFIHFHARFSSREGHRGTSLRTQNTSRSTAISDSSAGSTSIRDQERSEVQTLHLGFGPSLGCFPVDLASTTCLTSLTRAFWIHGRTNVVVISEFGEVVRHSGLCRFHSCALCCEVSHQGCNEGAQCPDRRITGGAESLRGAQKSQQCRKIFLQCCTFTPKRP